MDEGLIKKLQALRAMAERGTEHEAANAQRLLDKLIDKHSLSIDELEAKEDRDFKISPAGMRDYALHICGSLGLIAKKYRHGNKNTLVVNSTSSEFLVFLEIYRQVKALFVAQQKEAALRVKSYMIGFITKSYPISDKPPECPTCSEELKYSKEDRRYYCEKCGYIGKKIRKRYIDFSAMREGENASGTQLEYKKAV